MQVQVKARYLIYRVRHDCDRDDAQKQQEDYIDEDDGQRACKFGTPLDEICKGFEKVGQYQGDGDRRDQGTKHKEDQEQDDDQADDNQSLGCLAPLG